VHYSKGGAMVKIGEFVRSFVELTEPLNLSVL